MLPSAEEDVDRAALLSVEQGAGGVADLIARLTDHEIQRAIAIQVRGRGVPGRQPFHCRTDRIRPHHEVGISVGPNRLPQRCRPKEDQERGIGVGHRFGGQGEGEVVVAVAIEVRQRQGRPAQRLIEHDEICAQSRHDIIRFRIIARRGPIERAGSTEVEVVEAQPIAHLVGQEVGRGHDHIVKSIAVDIANDCTAKLRLVDRGRSQEGERPTVERVGAHAMAVGDLQRPGAVKCLAIKSGQRFFRSEGTRERCESAGDRVAGFIVEGRVAKVVTRAAHIVEEPDARSGRAYQVHCQTLVFVVRDVKCEINIEDRLAGIEARDNEIRGAIRDGGRLEAKLPIVEYADVASGVISDLQRPLPIGALAVETGQASLRPVTAGEGKAAVADGSRRLVIERRIVEAIAAATHVGKELDARTRGANQVDIEIAGPGVADEESDVDIGKCARDTTHIQRRDRLATGETRGRVRRNPLIGVLRERPCRHGAAERHRYIVRRRFPRHQAVLLRHICCVEEEAIELAGGVEVDRGVVEDRFARNEVAADVVACLFTREDQNIIVRQTGPRVGVTIPVEREDLQAVQRQVDGQGDRPQSRGIHRGRRQRSRHVDAAEDDGDLIARSEEQIAYAVAVDVAEALRRHAEVGINQDRGRFVHIMHVVQQDRAKQDIARGQAVHQEVIVAVGVDVPN